MEAHHVRLLILACEAWDQLEQARETIAREGLTVRSQRGGPRLHPLLRVETEARKAFARLIDQLDFQDSDPKGFTR